MKQIKDISANQLSILWSAIGSWLVLFSVDSAWVSRSNKSFVPGIGAIDNDPITASLWGIIVISLGSILLLALTMKYVKQRIEKRQFIYSVPPSLPLETENNRSKLISKWATVLFIFLPFILQVPLLIQFIYAKVWDINNSRLLGSNITDRWVAAINSDCSAYKDFCFKFGGSKGDQFFPIATDLIPLALFVCALILLFRWIVLTRDIQNNEFHKENP